MMKLDYLKNNYSFKAESCASGREKYAPSICLPLISEEFNQLCYEVYEEAVNCIEELALSVCI